MIESINLRFLWYWNVHIPFFSRDDWVSWESTFEGESKFKGGLSLGALFARLHMGGVLISIGSVLVQNLKETRILWVSSSTIDTNCEKFNYPFEIYIFTNILSKIDFFSKIFKIFEEEVNFESVFENSVLSKKVSVLW